MPNQVLYDSVTLQHFAKVSRLNILPKIHQFRDEPRWVEAVFNEISASPSLKHCADVLSFTWLGIPVSPLNDSEIVEVFNVQRRIAGVGAKPSDHLGESQSIVICKRLGATFVTDDRDAFRTAENPRYLGIGKVKKACSLFHEAQIEGLMTHAEIAQDHKILKMSDRHMLCTKIGFSCG